MRLERNGSEGLLILGKVLSEEVPQGFGLLRTQIDTVRVLDLDAIGRLLVDDAEGQEEIPYADSNLRAVRIALSVIHGLAHVNFGLRVA